MRVLLAVALLGAVGAFAADAAPKVKVTAYEMSK